MRNHVVGTEGKAVVRTPGANGAAPAGEARRERRRWSVEEKIRIVGESHESGETVAAVAARHGIGRRLLSSWRTRPGEGKLVAAPSAKAPPRGAYAAVEVRDRFSAAVEGRGVTVRLEGTIDAAGVAAIAVALAGRRR